jgi:2-phospho-L-lactate transferase/gluconeogenesis factor (CofD/UPF0052 family)
MNAKYLSALTAGLIAGGTSMIALLTNASTFSEISGPAYAVVAIGAVITVAKDMQSSNREPQA